jgi:hypothetical protein
MLFAREERAMRVASEYSAPELRRLGTVQELTQVRMSKIGGSADTFCPQLVGSVTTRASGQTC